MVGGGEGNNSHYLWSSPNTRHCITIHVYYLICTRQSIAVGISKALILQMRKWRPKELTQGHTSKAASVSKGPSYIQPLDQAYN